MPTTTTLAPPPLGCPQCGGDVALDLTSGAALLYVCQNAPCRARAHLTPPAHLLNDGDQLLIGTLDGIPVWGAHFPQEGRTADGRLVEQPGVIGWLGCTWAGERLGTDGHVLTLPDAKTGGGEDLTLAQYAWFKRVIAAGLADRLIALAQRYVDQPWPRGATAPTARIVPCICDDPVDTARFGTVIGYDYVVDADGVTVTGWVPNARAATDWPGVLVAGGPLNQSDVLTLDQAQALARNLHVLLTDPGFQAAVS